MGASPAARTRREHPARGLRGKKTVTYSFRSVLRAPLTRGKQPYTATSTPEDKWWGPPTDSTCAFQNIFQQLLHPSLKLKPPPDASPKLRGRALQGQPKHPTESTKPSHPRRNTSAECHPAQTFNTAPGSRRSNTVQSYHRVTHRILQDCKGEPRAFRRRGRPVHTTSSRAIREDVRDHGPACQRLYQWQRPREADSAQPLRLWTRPRAQLGGRA